MRYFIVILFLMVGLASSKLEEFVDDNLDQLGEAHLKRMSEQIKTILEHYKQPDPIGLPGVPISDPMPIPEIKTSLSLGSTMLLRNATVHGLSKFKIEQLESNLASMKVELAVSYVKLEVLGNYTLSAFFKRYSGGFNVTLSGVYIESVANMEVARYGNLEAADIKMDITFNDMVVYFQKGTILGSFFQGMLNTFGPFVFDSIKPFILSEVNTNIRGQINNNLRSLKQTFPNSIPPLDLAIAEGRKFVREAGYDPYKIENYGQTHSSGILSINITDILISGLASFYRIGNITISVKNNTLQAGLHVATNKLEGKCKWEVSVGGFLSKHGSSSFSVDYLQVEAVINQSLDVRNKPKLEEIQLKLGNIQLRMSGIGTFDYILEFLANVLPNILRFQIVDGVEGILKERIQEMLQSFDVERNIESYFPDIDNITNVDRNVETEIFLDPPDNALDFDDLYDDIYT